MRRTVVAVVLAAVGLVEPAARAAGPVREIVLASPHTVTAPTFDAAVGGSVFFTSSDRLVSLDTDSDADVYRWRAGRLTLMTYDVVGPVSFDAVTSDGNTVFVNASLGPGDTGSGSDVFRCNPGCYVRSHGIDATDEKFDAVSADGLTLVFDGFWSVSGSPARAVLETSQPGFYDPLAVASGDVHYVGSGGALSMVFVASDEALLPEDHNAATDVYVAGSGPLALVTNGTGGPDTFEASSANGQFAFWSTADGDASQGDNDGVEDIYRWGGTAQSLLVTPGTTQPVTFDGASTQGDHAFFSTAESLTPADDDATEDVYRWDDGSSSPALMSGVAPTGQPVTFDDAAPDGSSVVFSAGGTVYRSTGTTTTSLSGAMSATWAGASTSDSTQFFTSGGALYQSDAAGLTRIVGAATYDGSSSGGNVWFSTAARLSTSDTDAAGDIYLSRPDVTPPSVAVSAPSPQRNDGTVEVRVRCSDPAPCRTVARGVLRVQAKDGSVRRFALQARRTTIAPAHGVLLHLGVPSTARRSAAAALHAGRKVFADLTVTVRDPAGNVTVVRRTVRLSR